MRRALRKIENEHRLAAFLHVGEAEIEKHEYDVDSCIADCD